jgi:hypothetical protein
VTELSPVPIHGPAVLLQGPALLEAHYLLVQGIRRVQDRDGIKPPPRLRELLRLVDRAADAYRMSLKRHPEATSEPDQAASCPARELTTAETAEFLTLSVRQVQRLAPTLGAVRVGRAFRFDARAVEVFAVRRGKRRNLTPISAPKRAGHRPAERK